MVQFISYSGKYPNLCRGELKLKVNEKMYTFGNEYYNKQNCPTFWTSGGSTYFTNHYANAHVTTGDWEIDATALPTELQQYADEIAEVFNSNVRSGCCGGCL